MSNPFHYENDVMYTAGKVADTAVLGVLWLICSLPVFTAGAAGAAFYYAYDRCVRRELDHAWGTFFSAFRSNFKQATQLWLLFLGIMALAVLNCYLLSLMPQLGFLTTLLQLFMIVTILIGTILGLYVFPYLSRFDLPSAAVVKNCALIALANTPQSLLLLVLFAAAVLGFVCIPAVSLLIPAVYIFFANRIQEKIFRKYMRPEDLAMEDAK